MGRSYCVSEYTIANSSRTDRFVRPFLTGVTTGITRAEKYSKPVIEDRERQIEEHGRDYPGKPVRTLLMNIDDTNSKYLLRTTCWPGLWMKLKEKRLQSQT